MTKTHVLFAIGIAASLALVATGGVLLGERDGLFVRAPEAYGRPSAWAEDEPAPGEVAREMALEITEHLHLDVLEKLGTGLSPPQAGAVTALSAGEPKTLYIHSVVPVSDVERVAETGGLAAGPTMDEEPPAGSVSKVQSSGAQGNNNFRKNFLIGYAAGAVHGHVTDVKATLYVQGATSIEVTLFGDGGIGVVPFAARKVVAVSHPTPAPVEVDFGAVGIDVQKEIVIAWRTLTATPATTVSGTVSALYHDSTVHPSRVSFTLSPMTDDGSSLDDPAGIAFRAGKTIVLNAGPGNVFELDGPAAPVELAAGYHPGGFLRGLSDAVTDAAGNVYFSEVDTGKVHFLRPDGETGVYAKGLGAASGLAFNDAGDLFVGDATTGTIFKVAPGGAVSQVATLPRGNVFDLAFAPDGTLTASTFRPGFLWSVDVGSGAVAQKAFLGASTTAEGLAYDADGNLWVGSSEANATGRILRVAPDNTVALAQDAASGPIHLAFLPGQATLVVATQGELASGGDRVFTIATPAPGAPVAAPSLSPSAIDDSWQGWVHTTGRVALQPSAFAGTLPVGELLDVGREASEPTLAVQSDGDIFVVTGVTRKTDVAYGVPEPVVMRSQDNGRTWQPVSPTLAGSTHPTATVDPFVYVDPDTDRVFKYDLLSVSNYLSYSDDSGATWKTNPVASGLPPVDHQSIVAAKPRVSTTLGYPNVVYTCTNWLAASPCSRSLDGGDTWSAAAPAWGPAVEVGNSVCNVQGINGHLGADLEGRVFLGKNVCGRPVVAYTEDDGLSWKHVALPNVGIVGHDIDFAVDEDNTMYAAWIASGGQIAYAVSKDDGASWGPARFAAPPGVRTTQMPSIAAAGAGNIVISYIGTTTDYGYSAQNAGKTAWNAYLTVSVDADSDAPVLATVTAHPLSDPIVRGSCARPCGGIWDFLDVRIGPDGRVWATHVDSCEGACSTDRTAPSRQFANAFVATLSAGPDLRHGGALAPR